MRVVSAVTVVSAVLSVTQIWWWCAVTTVERCVGADSDVFRKTFGGHQRSEGYGPCPVFILYSGSSFKLSDL